jgi:hypothetical protein
MLRTFTCHYLQLGKTYNWAKPSDMKLILQHSLDYLMSFIEYLYPQNTSNTTHSELIFPQQHKADWELWSLPYLAS